MGSNSEIVFSLENVIVPPKFLSKTPSSVDQVSPDLEYFLRKYGCDLIQLAGNLLDLPQVAMATGQVLFHRFFYTRSFVKHYYKTVAMACVYLAAKVEESPRRLRDVINVFHHIKQKYYDEPSTPVILDQTYVDTKNSVIKAERRLLKELGFCVHVQHPHKAIVMFCKLLLLEGNKRLIQRAWNYMNDALRSDLFVRYSSYKIACACIALAADHCEEAMPQDPHWAAVFGTTKSEVINICHELVALYKIPLPPMKKIDRDIEKIRDLYQKSRRKPASKFEGKTPISEDEDDIKKKTKTDQRERERNSHTTSRSSKELEKRRRSRSRTPLHRRSGHKKHRSPSSDWYDRRSSKKQEEKYGVAEYEYINRYGEKVKIRHQSRDRSNSYDSHRKRQEKERNNERYYDVYERKKYRSPSEEYKERRKEKRHNKSSRDIGRDSHMYKKHRSREHRKNGYH